ncbi:MAG: hypothetical protein JNM90_18275 [Burkholderiales bacterium]|nr:hypothetical protein [Burkholderiales bacterium]
MALTTHPTFVRYIDRTRAYYAAQGYPTPYAWARHQDAPFAPLARPLAAARIAVVTTASPWRDPGVAQAPGRGAKAVWSGPTAPPPERLHTDDLAWDKENTHTRDVDTYLPLRPLAAFAAAGRIGGVTARFHGVPTDYSQRRTLEEDAPQVLARCREDGADAVLLIPL